MKERKGELLYVWPVFGVSCNLVDDMSIGDIQCSIFSKLLFLLSRQFRHKAKNKINLVPYFKKTRMEIKQANMNKVVPNDRPKARKL